MARAYCPKHRFLYPRVSTAMEAQPVRVVRRLGDGQSLEPACLELPQSVEADLARHAPELVAVDDGRRLQWARSEPDDVWPGFRLRSIPAGEVVIAALPVWAPRDVDGRAVCLATATVAVEGPADRLPTAVTIDEAQLRRGPVGPDAVQLPEFCEVFGWDCSRPLAWLAAAPDPKRPEAVG